MANIPLKTIKFPGLDDTYTVPQVDDDLDTAGAAADAKATGDALTEINERLGDVEDTSVIAVTTSKRLYSNLADESYESDYSVTIEDIDTDLDRLVIADSEIIIDEATEISIYESNGLTFTYQNGILTINGTSTAGTTCRFRYNGSNSFPLKKTINAGDSITFGVLCSNGTSDTNYNTKLTLQGQEVSLVNYVTTPANREKTVTTSADNSTCGLSFYTASGKTFNNLKICPYVVAGTTASFQMSAVSHGSITINSTELSGFAQIYTPLWEHVLNYIANTKKYIDSHMPNIDFDQEVYSREYYVSPEMFGAVGDGVTDDSVAINNAIAYGIANNCAIRGFRSYRTESTISVNGSGADIFIKKIDYRGSVTAVKISGSRNKIDFGIVYALESGAKGITFSTREGVYTECCELNVTYLFANSHAIYLYNEDGTDHDASDMVMSGHLLKGRRIRSTTGSIFYCTTGCAETTCIFGNLSNAVGYAFYLYEGSVRVLQANLEDCHAGFLVMHGAFILDVVRVGEMMNDMRSDSEDPTTGMLFSVEQDGRGYFTVTEKRPIIDLVSVDVSKRRATSQTAIGHNVEYFIKVGRVRRYFNYYYIPSGESVTRGNMITYGDLVIYGNRMAFIPDQKIALTISEDTHVENMKQLPPYRIIAGTDGVKVYLGDSYCPYGIDEFIVDQSLYTCDIYDRDDNLVFDGSAYGSGVYRVHITTVDPPNRAAENWGWVVGLPLTYYVEKINDVTIVN